MHWVRHGAGGMLNGLLAELASPLNNALKLAGWGAAVAIAAALALAFFSIAAFVWAEERYGAIIAALLLGTLYLLLTCAILIAALAQYCGAADRPARSNPAWFKDPAIVAAGIELVRIVGIRRVVPAVVLGVAIVAALERGPDSEQKRRSAEPR